MLDHVLCVGLYKIEIMKSEGHTNELAFPHLTPCCSAQPANGGHQTRKIRAAQRKKMAELMQLECLMVELGMFTGPRTRGRRPGG